MDKQKPILPSIKELNDEARLKLMLALENRFYYLEKKHPDLTPYKVLALLAAETHYSENFVRRTLQERGVYKPRTYIKSHSIMTSERPNLNPTSRYSVTDAAKALGLSRQRLYSIIHEGRIPFGVFAANQQYFILGKDIVRFWEGKI